jgi:hypothetical protein
VVIEHVISGTKSGAWWFSETSRHDETTIVSKNIWESAGLKEHNTIGVILLVSFKYTFIHWLQTVKIKVTWKKQVRASDPVTDVRLVQWIKTDNVRIRSEILACRIPKVNKFVL